MTQPNLPPFYTNLFTFNVMGSPEDNVKIVFYEADERGEDAMVARCAVLMSRSNALQMAAALSNALNMTDGAKRAEREGSNVEPFRPANIEPKP